MHNDSKFLVFISPSKVNLKSSFIAFPLMLCSLLMTSADCHTYQLRAYVYQARDMYASDKSGLSDPYIVLSFSHYSARSRVVNESVCPTWDQTLLISKVRIFGNPNSVLDSPPPVVMEFFDKDIVVSNVLT
jgi:hypothetical protein